MLDFALLPEMIDDRRVADRVGRQVLSYLEALCIEADYEPGDDVTEVPVDHCDFLSRIMEIALNASKNM